MRYIFRVWKTARVVAVREERDTDRLSNYRPIPEVPYLAEILETLVNNHSKAFLSKPSI